MHGTRKCVLEHTPFSFVRPLGETGRHPLIACGQALVEEEPSVQFMLAPDAERTTTVVIGAGMPGLAVASELSRRGLD